MAKDSTTITPEPWERQPEETPRAYEAFCIYRDMGVNRSLRKVVQQLDKSLTQIGDWSVAYEWVKRVAAWDAEQDRISRQAQIEEIQKMRKRHTRIAMRMLEKATAALEQYAEGDMSAKDIAQFVEAASKLERISRGDVGDVVEERDGGQAADPVQFYLPSNGRDKPAQDDADE